MPNYKGKKYSYDAKGKSAMKRDMMEDAKAGSGGGKSSKRKRSKMKSKLMQLNKTKFTGKMTMAQRAKND